MRILSKRRNIVKGKKEVHLCKSWGGSDFYGGALQEVMLCFWTSRTCIFTPVVSSLNIAHELKYYFVWMSCFHFSKGLEQMLCPKTGFSGFPRIAWRRHWFCKRSETWLEWSLHFLRRRSQVQWKMEASSWEHAAFRLSNRHHVLVLNGKVPVLSCLCNHQLSIPTPLHTHTR